MSREVAEAIVREAFVGDFAMEDIVSDVLKTAYEEPNREYIEAALWVNGAGVEHQNCPCGGPDPNDTDYENACGVCHAHLLIIADRIATEVTDPQGRDYGLIEIRRVMINHPPRTGWGPRRRP